MEYAILFGIYIMGVAFHVMQRIGYLRVKFPEFSAGHVFQTFFKEEWNTLIVSGLGLLMVESFWFIAHYKNIPLPEWLHNWGIYCVDLVCGYALQRIIYKVLGTAEVALENKLK